MKVKTSIVSTVISKTLRSVALKLVTGSVTSGTTGLSANGLRESNITFDQPVCTSRGCIEHNPENLERGKGWNLSTDGSQGAIIPAEVVWSSSAGGVNKLPGEYRAGYYYSSADATTSQTHSKPHINKGAGSLPSSNSQHITVMLRVV